MAPSLKDTAQANITKIGDPVSVETGEGPAQKDHGAGGDHKSLKQIAQEKIKTNPTQLGDPISMKAETSESEPTENDRGAGKAHPTGRPKL